MENLNDTQRCGIVNPDIVHVNRDVMLVRQLVRDGHNARIFRDDALPHLKQRCLSLKIHDRSATCITRR